jgi:4-amino-4-deoxy-L-arabinose transferase-like glycosyltransferase
MPLTFFLCLSIWLGYLSLEEQKKKYLLYLFYLSCALAFLTKGVIGFVFPAAILVIWLIWVGKWRQILFLISPIGIAVFLLVVCPWIIMAQMDNPDFLWFFFVREHLLRFTTKMHGKTEPFYFYLPILIAGTIPWLIYLIRAWRQKFLSRWLYSNDENKLLIVWMLFIFLFYSLSSSKLATYIAPAFLPLALWGGCIFRGFEEQTITKESRVRKIIYRIALIAQSLVVIIALLLPPFLKKYSDAEKGLVVMTSDLWYLYILLPLLALVLMTFLPDLVFRKMKQGWFFSIYILCALFLGSMLFPIKDFLVPYRSSLVAKDAIDRFVPKDHDLYQYRVNFYGIDFYNKIRTPIVEDFGELGEGIAKLSGAEKTHYFLSADEFFQLCRLKKDVYCITQHPDKLKEIKSKLSGVEILWDNGAFYLLHIKS